jgi:drug/metabolite transporter (DMT)-like permease
MITLVALAAAICFGSGDFLGGVAARRAGPLVATTAINVVALVLIAAPALLLFPDLSAGHLIAAVCGGVLSALTLVLIYSSFVAGAMSLAAPLIACGSVSVPTLTAIATGEPPSPLQGAGIVLGLTAALMITWPPRGAAKRATLGRRALALTGLAALSSGATLAVLQLAVAADADAGAAVGVGGLARAAEVAACLAAVLVARPPALSARPVRLPAAAAGLLEAVGTTLFLLATSLGNKAVVAVLVSLYAIATVVLAQLVLKERLHRHQAIGVATAVLGVALMSA